MLGKITDFDVESKILTIQLHWYDEELLKATHQDFRINDTVEIDLMIDYYNSLRFPNHAISHDQTKRR